ncbi:MAG: efflux RND transporter periplasmic adaptor subunit [Terracidiphilus sp.]
MTNQHPNESKPDKAKAEHRETHAPEQEPIAPHKAIMALVVVAVALGAIALFGYLDRKHDGKVLAADTVKYAAPTVEVEPAEQAPPVDNFVLPGNVTAFTDSPIYARTDGYLTHWYYDIGAHVKQGALLAEISTPELDQQLAQAEADQATAETNAGNAKVQAERYKGLVESNAVSKFDTDTYVTQAASTSSAVKSAQANVQRLKELQSFEKVYAPFDGVVTARNVDTGQLISQGAGVELFHMQALGTLRVYTNVPQIYSATIKRGSKIQLTFPEYPGKTFEGTLVRTADAIDPTSRTLLVEVDVNNRSGSLMPGSLAQVHFKTPQIAPTFVVPTAALIFRREGLQIGTVVESKDGTVAHLVPITIGQDDGATAQVVSGLTASDQVIQDPPDSIIEGEKVTVVKPGSNSPQSGGL